MIHILYLSLGSNLGDRLANIQTAISLLPPKILPLAQSSVYESEPWGYADQPAFLNQALRAETSLAPLATLEYLKGIEASMGRQKTIRYGPRLIDLDILFYDDITLDTPGLTIPHSHLAERAFVLVPLAEIAPDLTHPRLGKTIRQLISTIDSTGLKLYQNPTP
jgi:2-amino-4-hydroxy-6-hydroxymethyldihydropteridine diphosphokinase